jgi:CRP/FNR family cyclic AMP-dependent transcriptional regulator
MSLVPDIQTFQETIASLPVAKFRTGESVLTAGSTTGFLLVLKKGSAEVVKDGAQIAVVSTPGAVFGEMAVLLGQPHTADVLALEPSEFGVADASAVLTNDPAFTLYVAAVLARRLDNANHALIEVKRQLVEGEPRKTIGKSVETLREFLRTGGDAALIYGGYPYEPFGPDKSLS